MSRLDKLIQRKVGLCLLTVSSLGEMSISKYGLNCAMSCKVCPHNTPVGEWLCLD
ncbi:hypothetical protein VPHD292_0075 [Vibrio phage D292]